MKPYEPDVPPPKIPEDLLEWLEARHLATAPYADTATEAELRAYAADGNLIRMLRRQYEDQINPPEDQ